MVSLDREATEMHGADWCEAAGQSELITTRLKNLLKVGKTRCDHQYDSTCLNMNMKGYDKHNYLSLLLRDMSRLCDILYAFFFPLQDYPADISMFKEMVQNADDAGATEASEHVLK